MFKSVNFIVYLTNQVKKKKTVLFDLSKIPLDA